MNYTYWQNKNTSLSTVFFWSMMELQIVEHWWFGIRIWDTPKKSQSLSFSGILEIQTTENPNPPLKPLASFGIK